MTPSRRAQKDVATDAGELVEVVDGEDVSSSVVRAHEWLVGAREAARWVPTVDVLVDHDGGFDLVEAGLVSEPELVLVVIIVLVRCAGLLLVVRRWRR